MIERGEILPRRFSLYAAQGIKIARRRQGAQGSGKIVGTARQDGSVFFKLALARAAQQHLAAVAHLAGDAVARQPDGKRGIVRRPVLRLPEQHIARHRAFQPRLEAPVGIEQDQRHAIFRQAVHQRQRHRDVAETDHGAKVVQGHP